MSYKTIAFGKKGRLCNVTLNRPQQRNALDSQMAGEVEAVCREIACDEGISVVLLKGSGGVFSTSVKSQDEAAAATACQAIAALEQVTIAVIDGDAMGEGLELALACDIRLASQRAKFGMTHIAEGRIPSSGGTQRLPHLVGQAKALELILTADTIDADEALRIGLVSRVVPADELAQEAEDWGGMIAKGGPIALRYAKEAVNKGMGLTLEQGLRLEADLYFLIQTTADRMEGINAFMEKRPPQFKGE